MANRTSSHIVARLRIAAIIVCLASLFFVPLLFLLYGGLAAALGGVGFILLFSVVQLPVFLLLRYHKLIPKIPFGLPEPLDVDSEQPEAQSQADIRPSTGP